MFARAKHAGWLVPADSSTWMPWCMDAERLLAALEIDKRIRWA
ncbi:MAG TPA: hypothetical protein VIH45_03000 [Desulfuromonadaceae bacterium]